MICNICKIDYPETPEYFHRHKLHKNGLHSECKSCAKKIVKAWQLAHPERGKKYCKNWQKKNPQKVKAQTLLNHHKDRVIIISKCSCNTNNKVYHHPDYNKPYEVMELCTQCHARKHTTPLSSSLDSKGQCAASGCDLPPLAP